MSIAGTTATATTTEKTLGESLEEIPTTTTTTKQIINLRGERIFKFRIAMLVETIGKFNDAILILGRIAMVFVVRRRTSALALAVVSITSVTVTVTVTVTVVIAVADSLTIVAAVAVARSLLAFLAVSAAMLAIVTGLCVAMPLLGGITALRIILSARGIGRMGNVGFEVESYSTGRALTRSPYTIYRAQVSKAELQARKSIVSGRTSPAVLRFALLLYMSLILLMLLIFLNAGRWRTHILGISASAPVIRMRVVRISLIARICVTRIWLIVAAIWRVVGLLGGRLIGILGGIVRRVRVSILGGIVRGVGIFRLGFDVSEWSIEVCLRRWGEEVAGWILLSSLLIRIVVLVGLLIRVAHMWCPVGIIASVIVVVIITACILQSAVYLDCVDTSLTSIARPRL
jgi:hypothetical protein